MDWFHVAMSNIEVYCSWWHLSRDYRHWQDWHYSCQSRQRTHCSDKPVCSMLRCRLALQSMLQTLQITQYIFHNIIIEQQFQQKHDIKVRKRKTNNKHFDENLSPTDSKPIAYCNASNLSHCKPSWTKIQQLKFVWFLLNCVSLNQSKVHIIIRKTNVVGFFSLQASRHPLIFFHLDTFAFQHGVEHACLAWFWCYKPKWQSKLFILPKGMTEDVVSHSRIDIASFITTVNEKSEHADI